MLLNNINFLDENNIKKQANYLFQEIKIENINNDFFSEKDLILESEKKIKRFKNKKNNIFSLVMFKTLALFGYLNEKDYNKKFEIEFYNNLFDTLKDNTIISELERLNMLFKENNLSFKMKDIEFIMESKDIVKYLNKKGFYDKEFFVNILKQIEEKKPIDIKHYGNGRIKKIKRDISEIM